MKPLLPLILALTLLGNPATAHCYPAEVTDISGHKYFPAVKEALSKAQKSIYLVMYFVNFDHKTKNSPVNDLVAELVNAHKRGVKIKVILDQNVSFPGFQKESKNEAFFIYLRQQGIEAYFDNLFVVTHSKAIKTPSLAPRMLTARDETAFDLYLLLLRNFDGNPESRVDIDYKAISAALGLDEKFNYATVSDTLRKALTRLDKNYGLIRRVTQHPLPPYCVLLSVSPRENYCAIPDAYWKYGWNKRLSFPEKYCFLVNLRRASVSRSKVWSDYRQGIMDEFNMNMRSLVRGMMGLRKLNIIEIEYPPYPEEGGFEHRAPVSFRFLGLYSPEIMQKEKERLAAQYGKERFELAVEYAGIVYKENDIQVIEDIINKMNEYGDKKVAEAFGKVSYRSADNPKRSYRYVVGILQSEAEKGLSPTELIHRAPQGTVPDDMKHHEYSQGTVLPAVKRANALTIHVAPMPNADYMNNTFGRINFVDDAIITLAQGITASFISC